MTRRERFFRAHAAVLGREGKESGIGTLGEKTLHAILKYYLDENPLNHERKVGGFFADVMRDGEIFEIQTRNFSSLRKKLGYLLPEYRVTVVHPIARERRITWIDPASGELSPKRKSPKRGRLTDAIPELYRLRPYLTDPGLEIRLLLLDCDEYKKRTPELRAWRKTERVERIPYDLVEEVTLAAPEDYRIFLPSELPPRFGSAELAAALRIPRGHAQTALLLLTDLGLVLRVGREGRAIQYERAEAGACSASTI